MLPLKIYIYFITNYIVYKLIDHVLMKYTKINNLTKTKNMKLLL